MEVPHERACASRGGFLGARRALSAGIDRPAGEHDLSIPDQRRQLHAYCQAKGIAVVDEFVEPGASATDDRRPEFQKLMDAAAQKPAPFEHIIVHSFSRFFRDQFQLQFYVRRLAKNGIRLTSITQDLGDDPMSVMMRQIMALFDEYQSKENAKHTLRAMRENARQGYWNGSRPPFGYRIVAAEQRGSRTKKKIEPDPEQMETVKLMFRLARVGLEDSPMGSRQIAGYLDAHGIRTQTGGRWGTGAVHQILTRETYIGQHRFNARGARRKERKPAAEVVEVAVTPIISAEEFAEVQAMLRARSPQLKAPRFVAAGTLLGGVCFCDACGGAMTLRTGKSGRYRYYTCCAKARQGQTGCHGCGLPMGELNDLVVSHLEGSLLTPDGLADLLRDVLVQQDEHVERLKGRVAGLREQAAEAEAKLSRLYEAIEAGLADLKDSNLKGRIGELARIRDAALADADRVERRGEGGESHLTLELLGRFGVEARKKMRARDGGFRRRYAQASAQRVEVGEAEVRIKGAKPDLIQALVAAGRNTGVETAGSRVPSFVPGWLRG